MKVFMNRKPIIGPYGGGNLWVSSMHSLAKENGIELQTLETFDDPDVILVGGLDAADGYPSLLDCITYKEKLKNDVKIVLRLNENDARKGTSHVDEFVKKLSPELDSIVYVSDWLQSYFHKLDIRHKREAVIKNGVDSKVFSDYNVKIANRKTNIVAHHWSDNPMKGFDIYDLLDEFVGSVEGEGFTFTYIGRHRGTFKNTKVIPPMFGRELGKELGRYDVYVSASRFDPGPNHILEAVSCGLPTFVHKDGGGAIEFAENKNVYSDWEELKGRLLAKQWWVQSGALLTSWPTCVGQFCDHIKEVACQE